MTSQATQTSQQTAAAVVPDVDTVYENLRAALKNAGITLPSLGVDPVSFADRKPRPLIELGRCNLETAEKLTAALTNGRTCSTVSDR